MSIDEREAVDGVVAPADLADDEHLPLLGRLNQHGFRLVQLLDAIVLFAVMVGTALVRFDGWSWPHYPMSLYFVSFTVTWSLFLATYYFGGLYEREPRLGRPPVLPRVVRLSLVATGIFAVLQLAGTSVAQQLGYDAARALPMPNRHLLILVILGPLGIAGNRLLARWVQLRREGPPRVLLVGTPAEVELATRHLEEAVDDVRVVGAATRMEGLVERAVDLDATEVVLLNNEGLEALYPDTLGRFERRGINLALRVSAKETMYGLERVHHVGGLPFVLPRLHTMPVHRERSKRSLDVLLLAVLSPVIVTLLASVALYQLVVAGRPLLYWQTRVGAGGRTFQMLKFRTMRVDAEADGVARLADRLDPRVIPACNWIRASRLDELPQVYNVLRGEMSWVGPRPERPEITAVLEDRIPGYSHRHEISPGITGLAQIQGRYHTDAEYKLGYDLQYLVNWSPTLDLQILVKTVWVVLARRL